LSEAKTLAAPHVRNLVAAQIPQHPAQKALTLKPPAPARRLGLSRLVLHRHALNRHAPRHSVTHRRAAALPAKSAACVRAKIHDVDLLVAKAIPAITVTGTSLGALDILLVLGVGLMKHKGTRNVHGELSLKAVTQSMVPLTLLAQNVIPALHATRVCDQILADAQEMYKKSSSGLPPLPVRSRLSLR